MRLSLPPLALAALVTASLAAPPAASQPVPPGFFQAAAAPAFATGVVDETQPLPLPRYAYEAAGGTPAAVLPEAAVAAPDRLTAIGEWNRNHRQPTRNGFVRDLPVPQVVDLSALLRAATGEKLAGGFVADVKAGDTAGERIWATQVRIAGAWRLRLHLADVHLPAGSRLWVYGESGLAVGPFGTERLGTEADLWTPSVSGGTSGGITLEVQVPRAAAATSGGAGSGFRVDRVLELVRLDPAGVPVASAGSTPACLVDATCIDATRFPGIDEVQRAIGILGHVDSQGQFAAECTGSLLNDTDDTTTIPYFLTANHCVTTVNQANTLEVFFDDRTAACNGAAPDLDTLPRVNGSTLLSTSGNSDYTLLRLSRFPDNRRFLLGWEARSAVLVNGTKIFRLSHPLGLPQAYSESTFESHPRHLCSPADDGGIPINDLSKFIYLLPVFGGTFVGSSGSPSLLEGGRVVGTLTDGCGPNPVDGCDYRNDCADGAFSATFPAISRWLDPRKGGATSSCVPDTTSLCLEGGRFRVRIQWTTTDGKTGAGQAVPLTPDTGYFWFFDASNVEVVTKVLDGCSLGSRYWFFAGGLTDVQAVITVTDTKTAAVRTYTNPQGAAFQPIQDTSAFETCP
jgi:hypothetical protein